MHNGEHHDLFSTLNIVRMVKSNRVGWQVYVCAVWKKEKRNVYNVLMRIHEGKSPLGKPSRILVNNIKIYVIERAEVMWSLYVFLRREVSDRQPAVNIIMICYIKWNFLTSCGTIRFFENCVSWCYSFCCSVSGLV